MERIERLKTLFAERIVLLDGAWGVLIQREVRGEDAYRGERFRAHPRDVAGDPDLLNLTRPEVVLDIHRRYFAAGADIATTNTFTATRIGQADYGLEEHAAEMSLAGARLARQAADEAGGFVAGSVGPLNVSLSVSPKVDDAGFRAVTFDRVRDTYAEQIAALVEGGGRPAPDRDRLRHAERESGDRRRARGRSGRPALALLHGDRRQRTEPFRPDGRGVLDLGRACRSARRRRQLLPRRRADAPLRRSALAGRDHVRVLPSERRTAQRLRRARRASGRHEPVPARVRRVGPRQPRRRLLRDDAGPRPGDPRADRGPASPAAPRRRAAAPVQRPRAVRDRPRLRLRHGRRAHERHRLLALPDDGRGRRLRRCGRGRARAGARRRERPRREHGRRPARRRGGDDHVPERGRDRAGDRPAADHGRQLPVPGDRRRAEVHPGEGDRRTRSASRRGRRRSSSRRARSGVSAPRCW